MKDQLLWRDMQFLFLTSLCLSKSSWDVPRARISLCICTGTIKPWIWKKRWLDYWHFIVQRQSGEHSMCFCCSCGLSSASEVAGGDNALAVSKACVFGNAFLLLQAWSYLRNKELVSMAVKERSLLYVTSDPGGSLPVFAAGIPFMMRYLCVRTH